MNTPSDWSHVGFADNVIPDSCCKEVPSQGKCDLNSIQVHAEGCMIKLQSAIESNAMILGGVGIGIALIQVSSKSKYFIVDYIKKVIII